MLIIHADADIASESDLQEGVSDPVKNVPQPCPPILPTAKNLETVIAKWLNLEGVDNFPAEIILAIPAQDTENWVFASLFQMMHYAVSLIMNVFTKEMIKVIRLT